MTTSFLTKIKAGQQWADKKTGNILLINSHHHDIWWNCVLQGSGTTHKMRDFIIKKYFKLVDN